MKTCNIIVRNSEAYLEVILNNTCAHDNVSLKQIKSVHWKVNLCFLTKTAVNVNDYSCYL